MFDTALTRVGGGEDWNYAPCRLTEVPHQR